MGRFWADRTERTTNRRAISMGKLEAMVHHLSSAWASKVTNHSSNHLDYLLPNCHIAWVLSSIMTMRMSFYLLIILCPHKPPYLTQRPISYWSSLPQHQPGCAWGLMRAYSSARCWLLVRTPRMVRLPDHWGYWLLNRPGVRSGFLALGIADLRLERTCFFTCVMGLLISQIYENWRIRAGDAEDTSSINDITVGETYKIGLSGKFYGVVSCCFVRRDTSNTIYMK